MTDNFWPCVNAELEVLYFVVPQIFNDLTPWHSTCAHCNVLAATELYNISVVTVSYVRRLDFKFGKKYTVQVCKGKVKSTQCNLVFGDQRVIASEITLTRASTLPSAVRLTLLLKGPCFTLPQTGSPRPRYANGNFPKFGKCTWNIVHCTLRKKMRPIRGA